MEIIHFIAKAIIWSVSFLFVWGVFYNSLRDKKLDPRKDSDGASISFRISFIFTLFLCAITILIFF